MANTSLEVCNLQTIPAQSHLPLEDTWVKRPVVIEVEGRTVAGVARANWGAVEVGITSPVVNLSRTCDSRSWCFAMACHHRPEYRYALDGQVTPKAVQMAERMLADLYLDWRAVSHHGDEVDEACRRTRQELKALDREFDGRVAPLNEERSALRRRFKQGEWTQREYQASLKELARELDRIDQERSQAQHAVLERFGVTLEDRCGRKVSLSVAEALLTEAAIVVPAC